jgi:hypothetical protein
VAGCGGGGWKIRGWGRDGYNSLGAHFATKLKSKPPPSPGPRPPPLEALRLRSLGPFLSTRVTNELKQIKKLVHLLTNGKTEPSP